MYVHNPFAAPISMESVDFDVWWTDQTTRNASFVAHARGRNLNQIIAPGMLDDPEGHPYVSSAHGLYACVYLWQARHLFNVNGYA
jgi:hypothetical protein